MASRGGSSSIRDLLSQHLYGRTDKNIFKKLWVADIQTRYPVKVFRHTVQRMLRVTISDVDVAQNPTLLRVRD
jgi:hypothetical protein